MPNTEGSLITSVVSFPRFALNRVLLLCHDLQKISSVVSFDVVSALYMHGTGHRKLSLLDSCPHEQRLVGAKRESGLFFVGCSHNHGQKWTLPARLCRGFHSFDWKSSVKGRKKPGPCARADISCSWGAAKATWLILPVVIRSSQRLSHASLSINPLL